MAELPNILDLTAKIVSDHLSHNQVARGAIPDLIQNVYNTLARADAEPPEAPAQKPAVPIRHSVFPDHIVCLEDGERKKMLKRYLRTKHRMTPNEYREKWGLPGSYPMTAPNYARKRSKIAKEMGLGHRTVMPPMQKLPARWARGAKG